MFALNDTGFYVVMGDASIETLCCCSGYNGCPGPLIRCSSHFCSGLGEETFNGGLIAKRYSSDLK